MTAASRLEGGETDCTGQRKSKRRGGLTVRLGNLDGVGEELVGPGKRSVGSRKGGKDSLLSRNGRVHDDLSSGSPVGRRGDSVCARSAMPTEEEGHALASPSWSESITRRISSN